MKSKKVCSFILMCALVFSGIGFTQSQINTAYAMPSEWAGTHGHGVNKWLVWGEKDLRDDLKLVDERNCPQGRENVKALINTCIRENKKLLVEFSIDWTLQQVCYYSIV